MPTPWSVTLLVRLLAADDELPSVLDVDVAALGTPGPPGVGGERDGGQRLSAFDVADEDAESRSRVLRRLAVAVVLAVAVAVATAGSVALSL